MDTLYRCIKIAFMAALVWVGVEAALTLQATRATVTALPVAITAQLQPMRAAVTAINVQPVLDAAKAKIDGVPDIKPVLDAAVRKIDAVEIPKVDAQPTLDEATATLKDAHKSFDDMYWDLNALVQNMTVAAHGVAVTSDVIAQAAPQMVKTAQAGEAQVAGIATDVHTVTTQIAKPKTLGGKIWEGIKGVGWLARFI